MKTKETQKSLLIVTGMHRSGTSALAGTLKTLGFKIGGRVMPSESGENPKGFFEDLDIVALNDKLLALNGVTWDSLTLLPNGWYEKLDPTVAQEAAALLKAKWGRAKILCLKDPRFCLTADFWIQISQDVFGVTPHFLISIRNPRAVGQSLSRRNHFSQEKSATLWLNHYLLIEKSTRNLTRYIVEYNDLLHRPNDAILKFSAALDITVKNRLTSHHEQIQQFLDPKLCHYAKRNSQRKQSETEHLADRLYRLFCTQQESQSLNSNTALSEIKKKHSELQSARSPIQTEHIKELSETLYQAKITAEERTQWALDRDQKLADLGKQAEKLSTRLEENRNLLRTSEAALKKVETERTVLQTKFDEKTAELQKMQADLDRSRSEKSKALNRLAETKMALHEKENLNKTLRAQADTLGGVIERGETRLTKAQDKIERWVQEAHDLQIQLEKTTASLGNEQQLNNVLTGQTKKLEQKIEKQRAELTAVQEQAKNASAAARTLQIQLAQASTSLKGEQKLNQMLTEQNNSLEKIRSETERQLTETRNTLAPLNEKNEWLYHELLDRDQKIKEVHLQTKALQSKLEQATQKNQVLDGQFQKINQEYESLYTRYKKEQFTVLKPIYRNVYKKTGLALRKMIPNYWVDRMKQCVPNPDGIPRNLAFNISPDGPDTKCPRPDFSKPDPDAPPDIFVLSIINWDFRHQRPQHLAEGLAKAGQRTFYIEMEMNPATSVESIGENLYKARLTSELTGHIQPYTGQPSPAQTKAWIDALYELCDTVSATSFKQIIIQHPYWWQLARHLPPEFHVTFDCMDDISGFSNTQQFLINLEKDLLEHCDQLVVSSQYLFDKYKKYTPPTLVRNAAELAHFSRAAQNAPAPGFLKNQSGTSQKTKVGYIGAIAEWFDTDLLKVVAEQNPELEFHLCGTVTAEKPAGLKKIDNIFMYGEVPYSQAPAFMNAMDVLTIPFKLLPIIRACDPVKFYEYSAMGKPTVSTNLPELARAKHLTFIANSPEEFGKKIFEAYDAGKSKSFQRKLRTYAAENTWDHRIKVFKECLQTFPKVTIVILSYGDPELTKATLYSLYKSGANYPNMEVLIVDNGSPRENIAEIKKLSESLPNTRIIENKDNLGFAKGNNVGIEAATGEFILLLNNDTVVAPGAVSSMVGHLQRNPKIGVVGPLTNNIGNEAKLFVEYSSMEEMRLIARDATVGHRNQYTRTRLCAYFAVMFRKADFSSFGLLSEDYSRGMFEDDDHCATIHSKGFICALAEDAFVHHHLSATFSKLGEKKKAAIFNQNKKVFEKKWGKWHPHQYRYERPVASHKQ